jgi:hypothetical protein
MVFSLQITFPQSIMKLCKIWYIAAIYGLKTNTDFIFKCMTGIFKCTYITFYNPQKIIILYIERESTWHLLKIWKALIREKQTQWVHNHIISQHNTWHDYKVQSFILDDKIFHMPIFQDHEWENTTIYY